MSKGRNSALLPVLALFAGLGIFCYLEYRSYMKGLSSAEPPSEVKRNVYLVTATGLRPDHLSSFLYQSIQTPAMDYLAYDGIRFTNGWTASPESLPAHLSLLSGIYPFHSPVAPVLERFFARSTARPPRTGFTMPEWFRRKGYRTAAFLSDPDLRVPELMQDLFQTAAMGDRNLFSWQPSYTTQQACRAALDWIEKNSARPHLVLLNLDEPTPPYRPPAPFDRHYESYPYDGEIAALDEQIGLLVNRLKTTGLFERSVIVFTAPYAGGPGEPDFKAPLKNENLQVPIFIAAPGLLPRQNMYLSPAGTVDIFPTLVSLLSMDPAGLKPDGLPLFHKGSTREISRDAIFGGSYFQTIGGAPPAYFARSPGWKLVTGSPDLIFSSNSDNTPAETDVSRKMAAELKQKLDALRPSFSSPRPAGNASAAVPAAQALESARLGNVEEAYQRLADAADAPATPSYLFLRSELAEATGRLQEAIDLSQRAYRAVPAAEFLAATARQRAAALQFNEAEALMARYSKQVTRLSYYDHHMMGVILAGLGGFDGAVREFSAALEANPRFAPSLSGRSRCFMRLGNAAKALADLRQAAEQDPRDPEPSRELAAFILAGNNPQDAAPYLRRVLEIDPNDFNAMLDLARIHSASGNAAEAERLARDIITASRNPVLVGEAKKIIARQ